MVAGLVAVNIAAQQTFLLNILVILVILLIQRMSKEVVQRSHKLFITAKAFYHALHVVGNMERVVGAVAFDESFAVGLQGREILLPTAILIFGTSQTDGGIKYVTIVQRTLLIGLGHLSITCIQSGLIDGPIVIRILQGVAGAGSAMVVGNVTVFHIVGQAFHPFRCRSGLHSLQHSLLVFDTEFLGYIREHRYSMIATHAPTLVGHQIPDGQQVQGALLLNGNHALRHVGTLLRLQQVQKGMLCTIGIP